jgi:hypothetical protein
VGVRARPRLVLAALALGLAACAHPAAHEPPASRPDHRYAVPADVERLLVDDAAFAPFARALRHDVEADVAHGATLDRSTRRDRLFDLALLDALDGSWELAVTRLDTIAAEEPDPGAKVMTGLTIRVWADARRAGGDLHAAFAAALEERVRHMPYELLETPFAVLREMGKVLTRDYCQQLVRDFAGAEAATGSLSLEKADAVLFQRYVVVNLVPVGHETFEVMDRVIRSHGGE